MDNICIELINIEETKYICERLDNVFSCSWNSQQFIQATIQKDVTIYVAKNNNNILGFICIKTIIDQIDILNIAVDASYRGKGIGKLLVTHIIDIAKQKNFFPINIEVNVNNQPAIKLYNKVGFRIIHTRKGYYFNKLTNNIEDAYIMNFKEEYIC